MHMTVQAAYAHYTLQAQQQLALLFMSYAAVCCQLKTNQTARTLSPLPAATVVTKHSSSKQARLQQGPAETQCCQAKTQEHMGQPAHSTAQHSTTDDSAVAAPPSNLHKDCTWALHLGCRRNASRPKEAPGSNRRQCAQLSSPRIHRRRVVTSRQQDEMPSAASASATSIHTRQRTTA